MTEDEQIDAALAMLEQEPQEEGEEERQGTVDSGRAGMKEAVTQHVQIDQEDEASSPTLAALDRSRRPRVRTACEHCPKSMWFASPAETKCYCRVMYLITWSSKEPSQITHCDGPFME